MTFKLRKILRRLPAALLALMPFMCLSLRAQEYFPARAGFRVLAARPLILGSPYETQGAFRTPKAFRNYQASLSVGAEAYVSLPYRLYIGAGAQGSVFYRWQGPMGEPKFELSSSRLTFFSPFIGWQSFRPYHVLRSRWGLRVQGGPAWGRTTTLNVNSLLSIFSKRSAAIYEYDALASMKGFQAAGDISFHISYILRADLGAQYSYFSLSPGMLSESSLSALTPHIGIAVLLFHQFSYYKP